MDPIQLLQASNTISRRKGRLQQELVVSMTVENLAWEKNVEVHWAGEDGVWHRMPARYQRSADNNREVWRAQAVFHPSDDASLPGDVKFALRYGVRGRDYWDNNRNHDYELNADSGVLLERHLLLLNVDFNPRLETGRRIYPITVAVRHSLQPRRVFVHWTTDGWRTCRVTPCEFKRMHWDRQRRSGARNPNRYDTAIWACQIRVDDAYRLQYAIGCETSDRTLWDNNFARNYAARRRRFRVLTLNLHTYQEDNQDAKFSRIAEAIDALDIDVVCFQEVGELWNDGNGDWNSNAARIIRDRMPRPFHLHTDWSHRGFDRYREGIAVLSRYPFGATDSGYVSASQDPYSIDSRKVVMVQVEVPYLGLVNVFSAHLSWLSGGFLDQFERLRQWANLRHDERIAATLLCGDFNVKAGSEGYQAVVRTQEFEDQYLAATAPNVFDRIFRRRSPQAERDLAHDGRIDYLFMHRQSSLVAVDARELFTTGDRYGRVSDHVGYCVDFEPRE